MILARRRMTLVAALAILPVLLVMPLAAQDAAAPEPAPAATADPAVAPAAAAKTGESKTDEKVSVSTPQIELTPEEKAEKDSRKACKAEICSAFRGKQASGGDISCNVVKSWRKEQLSKLVGKMKVSWPYGPVRCTSAVTLKRAELIKAMTDDKLELQLDKHSVACVVDREKDAPTNITFDFSPKVSFEKGKAIKAKINWGKVEAPTLVKGALWTATAADNTVNLLSGTLVDDINDFIGKKCDEVKDEWAKN